MESGQRGDGFVEIGDRYAGYTVYDRNYEKVGKVDDLFVDENDRPEYIGVKTGLFGLNSTLIPFSLARANDERRTVEIATDKETIKNGPNFSDDQEITPEFEQRVYSHYGVDHPSTAGTPAGTPAGAYGGYYSDAGTGATGTQPDVETGTPASGTETGDTGAAGGGNVGAGMTMGDTESGTFEPHGPGQEGVGADDDKSDLEDEDELRVRRSEEELRAGTREREAGRVNVRKRVRTDRERIEVPTRHEEVSVERVPVDEPASGAEIGEDEVSVPVTEEEAVVGKETVAKEEIRLRKDVVEGTETVEEDVRREEVDVEDATERRDRDA